MQGSFRGPNGGNPQGYIPGTIILSRSMNSDMTQIYSDLQEIFGQLAEIDFSHFKATSNVHGIGQNSSVVGTNTQQTLTNKLIELGKSGNSNNITGIKNAHIDATAAIAWSKIDKTGSDITQLGGYNTLITDMQPPLLYTTQQTYAMTAQQVKDSIYVCNGTTSFVLPIPTSISTTLVSARIWVMNRSLTQSIVVTGFGPQGMNADQTKTSFTIPPQRTAIFCTGTNATHQNCWYEMDNMILSSTKLTYNSNETSVTVSKKMIMDAIKEAMMDNVEFVNGSYNDTLKVYPSVVGTNKDTGIVVYRGDYVISGGVITGYRTRRYDKDTGAELFDVTDVLTVDNRNIPIKRTVRY